MKHGVRLTTWLSAWLLTGVALAAPPLRVAVVADPAPVRDAFISALTALPDVEYVDDPAAADVLLAPGDPALDQACAGTLPVIGVQVGTRAVARWRSAGCRLMALWRHPDPVSQLRLLHAVFPRARRVGFLASPETRALVPVLRKEAQALNIDLVVRDVDSVAELSAGLAETLAASDVLMALPDPLLYNADQARLILMATYRQGKPLVGPDDHWVRAGAIASAYISAEDVLVEVADVLAGFQRDRVLSGNRFLPVSIELNTHVARTFSISLPAPAVLQDVVTEARP